MTIALYIAPVLIIAVGIAHSYLGERYILVRLFRWSDLRRLFGRTEFTIRTLRFTWHVTTIAWLGFAAVLVLLAYPPITTYGIDIILAVTLLATAAAIVVGSRGKHLAWRVFLIAGIVALYAAGA